MIYVTDVPELFALWDKAKNSNLDPNKIKAQSNIRVWWLCSKGHEWDGAVNSRYKSLGCPFCQNKRVLSGFNDLKTINPSLAEQWHPTMNGLLNPKQIFAGSSKKVWWQDEHGHEWEATIAKRHNMGRNCPICVNQKTVSGLNDLATTHPELTKQWHPTRNKLTPQDITAGSNKKGWWQDEHGHEWEATIAKRSDYGRGCPYCSHKQVLQGFNDFATTHPELASELHPTKNNVTAEEVFANGKQKIWWLGKCGHEWEAALYSRAGGNQGCPICVGRKNLPGFNDLGTAYPSIAKQWHPTKNNNKKPSNFTSGSPFRAWWVCEKGHEWEVAIYSRTCIAKPGCPVCSKRVSKPEIELAEYIERLFPDAVTSTRSIISPLELDIYVPSKRIAIEFNGIYWHSDRIRPDAAQRRHFNKWKACKEKDVQLIQIWEDEWVSNPGLVKNMLSYKLGVRPHETVYARKTSVKEISKTDADIFLDANHIQGKVDGKIKVALTEGDKIVAVMVLKTQAGSEGTTLSLLRYATAKSVVGGFTKLLNYVEKTYSPKQITTFSDHCVSDGRLYESNGFIADKEIRPDYMYVVNGKRVHKFNYRLKRFRNDPNLKYVEGLSETQLAQLNELPRVWDAGKTRWVKKVNP